MSNKFDMRKVRFTVVRDNERCKALMGIEYVCSETPLKVAYDISSSAYFTHEFLDKLIAALAQMQDKVEGRGSHDQIDDKSTQSTTEERLRIAGERSLPDPRQEPRSECKSPSYPSRQFGSNVFGD